MTNLTKAISERLRELDWQQKRLAHEWCRKVGKKSVSTFESRLSNLMSDEEAGYAFVLDGDDSERQLSVLAEALGWTPKHLREICENARRRPTLVLDPRLPREQQDFFVKRAETFPGNLQCVRQPTAPNIGAIRDALRDLAKAHRNAIVVVLDGRDDDFYAGAGVRTSTVEAARPGFRVLALPDIFPQLPARTQDADGMKMLPDADVESKYRDSMLHTYSRREGDERWIRQIAQADAEGTPVAFRLDWLVGEWGGARPEAVALQDVALAMATVHIKDTSESRTRRDRTQLDFVWLHGDRVLALCSEKFSYSRKRVEAHVTVENVMTFDLLVTALRRICERLNPYGEGGSFDLTDELTAFVAETGLELNFSTEAIRDSVRRLHPCGKLFAGVVVRRSEELDARVHAVLDDILGREIIVPASRETIVWMLDLVRSAPLLHLAAESRMLVLADIGTGHVLRLDITQFPGEEPAAIRFWGNEHHAPASNVLDGGNVRLAWSREFDISLEGTSLRVVRRRREAAEQERRRAAEDD